MRVWLEKWKYLFTPLLGCYWGKYGRNRKRFCTFIPLEQKCNNLVLRFRLGTRAKTWGSQKRKNKNNARVIFYLFVGTPPLGWSTLILACRVTSPTRRNHPCQILRQSVQGFRTRPLLIPPILPFFIGIAGRPYNCVSTTVLHCDKWTAKQVSRLVNSRTEMYASLVACWPLVSHVWYTPRAFSS